MQGVIFLYLLDNNENTSWMILLSQGMWLTLPFKGNRIISIHF